jgi:hypothetical protein
MPRIVIATADDHIAICESCVAQAAILIAAERSRP